MITSYKVDILIFHNDVSQSLFCLITRCIQQFHWLIILSNNLFHFGVGFFFNSKMGKKIQYKENKLLCFSRCVCTKSKIFLSAERFLKWTPTFIVRKEKIVNLLVEKLNGKFYWLNVYHCGFKNQSLTWNKHCISPNLQAASTS